MLFCGGIVVRGGERNSEWIEKAKNLNQRDLEKEIKTSQGSTTKSFHCEVNLDFESTLRRIQDIMSQKLKKPVSRSEAIELMAKEYLHRHDPVQKAERALARIDLHHIKPRSHGGSHAASNLTVLCSAHHRMTHSISGGELCIVPDYGSHSQFVSDTDLPRKS